MFITYKQTSEQSYLLDYGEDINFNTNKKVISHFKYLLKKNYKYILNVVPSFNKLLIVFDIEFKKDIEILIKKLINGESIENEESLANPECLKEFELVYKNLKNNYAK